MITFNTDGLDFFLTALFVVIFIDQWKSQKNHKPAIIGVACSIVSLIVFGSDNFIIPAMIAIIGMLIISQKENVGERRLEEGETR